VRRMEWICAACAVLAPVGPALAQPAPEVVQPPPLEAPAPAPEPAPAAPEPAQAPVLEPEPAEPPVASAPTAASQPAATHDEETAAYEVSDISALSLEELLDLPTTVASKREERTSDASAIVTGYTARDLEALGYYSLYELADFTAGYSSTVTFGERVFETRGQKAGSFNNNKHLVYLNGIPINHARNYKAPADRELPLYFAERVEFLKGPASALYGTSAFFGVVNLVPKQLTGAGALVETRVSAGTRDQEFQLMSNGLIANAIGQASLSVGYYGKAASRDYAGVTDSAKYRNWDDQKSVFVHASHRLTSSAFEGLSLGLIYMRKDGGLGEHWNGTLSHQVNELTWETLIPYLKFERAVTEDLMTSSYLMWNRGRERGGFITFSDDGSAGDIDNYAGTGVVYANYDTQIDDIQGQTELRWNVHDRAELATEVIVGVNVDTRQADEGPDTTSYSFSADPPEPYVYDAAFARGSDRYNIYSAYLQLRQQAPVLSGLILTAGARFDHGASPTQGYNQFSPRAGLVQRVTPNLNLRVFYGQALYAPGIKEIELNKESGRSLSSMNQPSPIKDVSAEQIRSVEGGPVWASEHVVASVTAFYNETIDSLESPGYVAPNGWQVNYFVNASGKTKAFGGEGELTVVPVPSLKLIANYAFAKARLDRPGPDTVVDVPVMKLNAAVEYLAVAPIDLSAALVARWISAYRAVGPDTDGRFALDLNLQKSLPAGFALWAQLKNLTNDRTKLPKGGREDVPVPGITALFSISHRLQ
jgi:outer membrane receptor for ferrienterochelin and colicins